MTSIVEQYFNVLYTLFITCCIILRLFDTVLFIDILFKLGKILFGLDK